MKNLRNNLKAMELGAVVDMYRIYRESIDSCNDQAELNENIVIYNMIADELDSRGYFDNVISSAKEAINELDAMFDEFNEYNESTREYLDCLAVEDYFNNAN